MRFYIPEDQEAGWVRANHDLFDSQKKILVQRLLPCVSGSGPAPLRSGHGDKLYGVPDYNGREARLTVLQIDQLRNRQGQWLLPVLESWNDAKKRNQICQDLEAELERLECIHAERLWILRTDSEITAGQHEYNRIGIAEGDARRDVEIVRSELEQHMWRRAVPAPLEPNAQAYSEVK